LTHYIWHIDRCKQEFGINSLLNDTQQLSLWAKQLLSYHTGLPLDIDYSSKGKPFLKTRPDIQFSISHTSDYVAVALSDNEIGIDIEHLRLGKHHIARRFFTDEENNYLSRLPLSDFDVAFTKLWTLKEAYAKCTGTGISGSFNSTTIDLPSLSVKGSSLLSFQLTSLFDSASALYIAICQRD
jgi:4'-phosphopantetheinyl transferase